MANTPEFTNTSSFRSLQYKTLMLIDSFLDREPIKDKTVSLYHLAKERNSLEIKLPRGEGSTTLCHHLAHIHGCPVILHNMNAVSEFNHVHKLIYNEKPESHDCNSLKGFPRLGSRRAEFETALDKSKLVLFDVFSAFDNNKEVKRLMETMPDCQYIMFR